MISERFFKFLWVGGINTAFGYTIFALLVFIGLHYTMALLLGTVLGVLFNFQTTGRIVFNETNPRLIWHFVGVYAFLYGCNVVGMYWAETIIANVYVSGAVLLLPMALLSFALNKYFVFERNHEKD